MIETDSLYWTRLSRVGNRICLLHQAKHDISTQLCSLIWSNMSLFPVTEIVVFNWPSWLLPPHLFT
jgi:hypothetical protein